MKMARLVVRNLSDDLVKALKQRAAKHYRRC
jgi:plasmid stability protein